MTQLGQRVGGRIRFTSCLIALLALTGAAQAQSPVVETGHTALWYDPARSGEGFVLEILHDERALLYWYTYDEQGNQRWVQGIGGVTSDENGQILAFPEFYITRGGRFGPDFDPDEVEIEFVGEAEMRFADCDRGTFSYSAFGQSQTFEIRRLSQTMAAGCAPIHGVTGEPVRDYAGQSGTWYDRSHSGEGYSLQWLSRDEALLTWYTYDTEGNQRWMIGVGHHEDGRIVFPMLQTTRGARFGEAFNPSDVERIDWGSVEMELACSTGQANYESIFPAFGAGSFDLVRLTMPELPGCPWIWPELTDLYRLELKEVPVNFPGGPERFEARGLSDDGTVVGWNYLDDSIWLWRPGDEVMEELTFGGPIRNPLISPDGETIYASAQWPNPGGAVLTAVMWQDETGWQPLHALELDVSTMEAVSKDGSHVVGLGYDVDDTGWSIWILRLGGERSILPAALDSTTLIPVALSNDGTTIVGHTWVNPAISGRSKAVRWLDGNHPEYLIDAQAATLGRVTACSADCGLITGAGLGEDIPEHPLALQAWFWKGMSEVRGLGELPTTLENLPLPVPLDITPDGTLIVGNFNDEGLEVGQGAFIWTQDTGFTSVRRLLEDEAPDSGEWTRMNARAVAGNGSLILIDGSGPKPNPSLPARPKVQLLHLIPKR